MSEENERQTFLQTVNAFREYELHSAKKITCFRKNRLRNLPVHQQKKLHIWGNHLDELENRIHENSKVAAEIAQTGINVFAENYQNNLDLESPDLSPSQEMHSKVSSTFRQIAREWSSTGFQERRESYTLIFDQLSARFPVKAERSSKRVLCPGSGLGRIVFDLACLGFAAEGNEFSTHMLFASYMILNMAQGIDTWTIYPYIHSFSGIRDKKTQLAAVQFPDVDVTNVLHGGGSMSMTCGEFCESYSPQVDAFDAVVTMFFIDCSPNFLDTLETITTLSKKGAVWINIGPLQWHYEDVYVDKQFGDRIGGLDFSLDVVLELVQNAGWVIETRRTCPSRYCHVPESMAGYEYECEYWVAVKA